MLVRDSALRDLAARRCEPFVVSLYLDVDGRRAPRPTDLEPRVEHLFRVARAAASALGTHASAALEDDLAEISAYVTGLDRHTTRGLAMYGCGGAAPVVALALPVPVVDEVRLGPVAHLAPLLVALRATRTCLAVLVDRAQARFVEVSGTEVAEHAGPAASIARRVDTGVELGSFDRQHEEARRRHLRAVAAAVERAWNAAADLDVLVGGPEAKALTAELSGTVPVAGALSVAMAAPAHEVGRLAEEARRGLERRRQEGLVEDLSDRLGTGATLGVEATLDALATGRVATLVVGQRLALAGGRCSTCGRLAGATGVCGRCGGGLERVDDLVAEAVADALVGGGEVDVVDVPRLAEAGGMAALERY